jgi:hypothetical protein
MEKKTVLRLGLMKWGYFDPHDVMRMSSSDETPDSYYDGLPTDVTPYVDPESEKPRTEAEILSALGFNADPKTGEIIDAKAEDVTEPEPEQKKDESLRQETDPKPAKAKITRPMTAEQLKSSIITRANKYIDKVSTDQQRALFLVALNQIFENDTTKRNDFLTHLLGESDIKKFNGPLIIAMLDWLKPVQDSGGAYTVSPMAEKEAKTAYQEFIKDSGEGEQEGLFEE